MDVIWVDEVPRRRAKAKRVVIGEHEWRQVPGACSRPPCLRASFFVNGTEVVAVLRPVDEPVGGQVESAASWDRAPRLRIRGLTYSLSVQVPDPSSDRAGRLAAVRRPQLAVRPGP